MNLANEVNHTCFSSSVRFSPAKVFQLHLAGIRSLPRVVKCVAASALPQLSFYQLTVIHSAAMAVAGAVDFSEKTIFTGPHPCFSPDKKHVALAQDFRLVIRDVETLAVVGLFSCLDRIEALAWSPSGEHILCGMYKRGTVQVFSIVDQEWTCCITEGLAGIVSARWCPSGQDVLLTAEFQVKLSVWSLVDQSCHHLPPPKHAEAGVAFSPDGTMLAVIQRWECKDSLQVYDVASWQSISHVPLPTVDAADLAWSPDSSCIAVWDSISQGPLVAVMSPEGDCLAMHRGSPGQGYGLGVKSVAWSPSGQLLAIGSHDQDVSVLNHVTWAPLTSFEHAQVIAGPASAAVYQEEVEQRRVLQESNTGSQAERAKRDGKGDSARPPPLSIPKGPSSAPSSRNASPTKAGPPSARGRGPHGAAASAAPKAPPRTAATVAAAAAKLSRQVAPRDDDSDDDDAVECSPSRFVVGEFPLRLPAPRPPADRANPKMGIGVAVWSGDGALLATRCDARPNVMWIWDSATLELAAVMTLASPVKAAAWDPSGGRRLVMACGSRRLYVWTPEGASCVQIPVSGVKSMGLAWSEDGSALMVIGKDAFCCCYVDAGASRAW